MSTATALPRVERMLEAAVGNRIGSGIYRRWVESLGLVGDEAVLEVGCGAGACAKHLARALPSGTLTCIDVDPRRLEVAQDRLGRADGSIELVRGDITAWSRAKAFDAVAAHFVLHDIASARLDDAVANIAASLRPGGRLFLRDPATHGLTEDELLGQLERAGFAAVSKPISSRLPLMGMTVAGTWRLTVRSTVTR